MRFFFQAGVIGSVWDQPWSLGSLWAQVSVCGLLQAPSYAVPGEGGSTLVKHSIQCAWVASAGESTSWGLTSVQNSEPLTYRLCLPRHLWWQMVRPSSGAYVRYPVLAPRSLLRAYTCVSRCLFQTCTRPCWCENLQIDAIIFSGMGFSKNKNFKKEIYIILSKMYWYESCEGWHILIKKLCGLFKFLYR